MMNKHRKHNPSLKKANASADLLKPATIDLLNLYPSATKAAKKLSEKTSGLKRLKTATASMDLSKPSSIDSLDLRPSTSMAVRELSENKLIGLKTANGLMNLSRTSSRDLLEFRPWTLELAASGDNSQPKVINIVVHIKERIGTQQANKLMRQMVMNKKYEIVATIMKSITEIRNDAGHPENELKSCPFCWKTMIKGVRVPPHQVEAYIHHRLNLRLGAVQSKIQFVATSLAEDQGQPLAMVPEMDTNNAAIFHIVEEQEEPTPSVSLVQEFIKLVSEMFGANIFTCLVAVLLFGIFLWVFKENIWRPSSEEERYQEKMQKSGLGLRCLFFLLRKLDVPIF